MPACRSSSKLGRAGSLHQHFALRNTSEIAYCTQNKQPLCKVPPPQYSKAVITKILIGMGRKQGRSDKKAEVDEGLVLQTTQEQSADAPIRKMKLRNRGSACTEMIELHNRQDKASQLPMLSSQLKKNRGKRFKLDPVDLLLRKRSKKPTAVKKESRQQRLENNRMPTLTQNWESTTEMTKAEESTLTLPTLVHYEPNKVVEDLYEKQNSEEIQKQCQTLTRRQAVGHLHRSYIYVTLLFVHADCLCDMYSIF